MNKNKLKTKKWKNAVDTWDITISEFVLLQTRHYFHLSAEQDYLATHVNNSYYFYYIPFNLKVLGFSHKQLKQNLQQTRCEKGFRPIQNHTKLYSNQDQMFIHLCTLFPFDRIQLSFTTLINGCNFDLKSRNGYKHG